MKTFEGLIPNLMMNEKVKKLLGKVWKVEKIY